MIESAPWLTQHAAWIGINPAHISDCSAEVTLGHQIIKLSANLQRSTYDLTDGQRFVLKPHSVFTVRTHEAVRCPKTHTFTVRLTSALAEAGLDLTNAAWGKPNSSGRLTLTLRATVPVEVKVGQVFASIFFHRLAE